MPASLTKNAVKAIGSVKKAKNAISIYIDLKAQTVHFFLHPLSDKAEPSYEAHSFRQRTFDQNFFRSLTDITSGYASAHSEAADAVITLVLPDYLFALDTLSIPTLGRKKTDGALDVMLDGLYKNRKELFLNTVCAHAGKKITTYSSVAFNRSFHASFVSACTAGNMKPDCVTFRSNAYANAVSMLDTKYSSSSYLMLNICQNESTFVFVSKGRATGFYPMPFGYKLLQRSSVVAENLLFDHDTAELAVLNAKEKAKAKQLTTMRTSENGEENQDAAGQPESTLSPDDPTVSITVDSAVKELPRKVARVVPKAMQRPAPRNQEEAAYENFTVFMKWALHLLEENDKLVAIGRPETILVNLPDDCAHVIETANAEREENGISFTRLDLSSREETVREHLDLVGGLCSPAMNKINNF